MLTIYLLQIYFVFMKNDHLNFKYAYTVYNIMNKFIPFRVCQKEANFSSLDKNSHLQTRMRYNFNKI